MNTESNAETNAETANVETIDFSSMSDAELRVACGEYYRRAQRAIEASRAPGPMADWSTRAQESNLLVSLYLQADSELRERDRLRTLLTEPAPWKSDLDYDPAPTWLMVLVGVGVVVATALLVIRAGVW